MISKQSLLDYFFLQTLAHRYIVKDNFVINYHNHVVKEVNTKHDIMICDNEEYKFSVIDMNHIEVHGLQPIDITSEYTIEVHHNIHNI